VLRVYQDWYDQSIDFMNNMKGERTLQYRDGTEADAIIWHYLTVFPSFAYDVFRDTSGFKTPMEWFPLVLDLLDVFSDRIDDLFKLFKSLVKWLRSGARISELKQIVKEEPAAWMLLKYPGCRSAIRNDVRVFGAYHALFLFMAKITIEHDSLESEALQDYLDREAEISDEYPDERDQVVRLIQHFLSYWLSEWDEQLIFDHCKYSAGSTADVGPDPFGKVTKSNPPDSNKLVGGGILCQAGTGLIPIPPELYELVVSSTDYDSRFTSWFYPEYRLEYSGRISRLMFVPKNALTRRTISMENSQMNFFQNGLDYSIRHCKSMPKQSIDFEDQGASRALALEGSKTGELATEDFSAASDRITAAQVWTFFADTPRLRLWLFATRSTWTRYFHPDCGGFPHGLSLDIPLKKFAAMGSCTCFTVETLVFCAAAYAACALTRADWKPSQIRVYGDDVIIPVWAHAKFLEISKLFGWQLNEDKSYASGPFREACGVYAYAGKDITYPAASRTPIKIFAKHSGGQDLDWSSVSAACEMANQLLCVGCEYTRYTYIQYLIRNRVHFLSRTPSVEEVAQVSIPRDPEHRSAYPTAPLVVWTFSHLAGGCHSMVTYQPAVHADDLRVVVERHRTRTKPKRLLTIAEGYGCTLSVPKAVPKRNLNGNERLAYWLYLATYTERRPIDMEARWLPFVEPISVAEFLPSRRQSVVTKRKLLSL
jgi:hypothetical protein